MRGGVSASDVTYVTDNADAPSLLMVYTPSLLD
jgi:hypothetical protein